MTNRRMTTVAQREQKSVRPYGGTQVVPAVWYMVRSMSYYTVPTYSLRLSNTSRVGRINLESFQAQHPSRPTAYPHMGVQICFPINITASEVLPPDNRFFYSIDAPNLVHLIGQKNPYPPMGVRKSSPQLVIYSLYCT